MNKRRTRLTLPILAALSLVAASLACGRQTAGSEPTPIVVATPTPAPAAGGQPTAPPEPTLTPSTTPIVVVATPTPAPAVGGQPTAPPEPTLPPEPTSPPVPGGCADGMQFVADVTVPDGTAFDPNEHFIKTWRVRNSGSCDWAGYHVVFDSGEPMGTMDQPIPDTPAGEELDISIEMTAPGGPGNYTGRWQVQSPDGTNLGNLTCVIAVESGEGPSPAGEPTEAPMEEPTGEPAEEPTGEPTAEPTGEPVAPPANLRVSGWGMHSLTFAWDDATGETDYILMLGNDSVSLNADTTSYMWEDPPCGTTVEIVLIARDSGGAEIGRATLSGIDTPACPAQPQTVTLQSLPAEDGYVRGLDSGASVNLEGDIKVGDGKQNSQQQAFLSFDISAIPQGATIQEATLDLSNHTVDGDPFAALGVLRAYKQLYETLDTGDFVAGFPDGFAEWSGPPGTANVTAQVQRSVNNGVSRFQVRLQFQNKTDNDGAGDRLRFPEGGPALTITYVH